MELGLACSVCSHLNPLRAATCDRCNAALAPRIVGPTGVGMSSPSATPSGSPALRSAAAPVVGAVPAAVINIGAPPSVGVGAGAGAGVSGGAKLMGTMQLPTVQPAPNVAQPQAQAQPQARQAQAPVGPLDPLSTLNTPLSTPTTSPPRGTMVAQPAPRFNAATGLPEGPVNTKPAAKTMFFGALQQQAVVPRLVVIKGEGGDGVTYHLSATNHTVGRSTGDIRFSEDLFLNPEHARFTVQGGRLFVKDLGTVNGVFVRIKSPVQLEHNDYFLVGEQLLRIDSEPFSDGAPDEAGTYSYSSPRPDGRFRVVQQLAGGGEGRIVSAQGAALTLGREGNTINFPQDRFISGRHARLDAASDSHHVILTDTGSRNGTFVRTKGALELFHGDYLFVGQQLLRVEIS
ncbi:FHA domain-containing protein [Nannocystis sp.]|uniref:FHA domain-containing protein n=1 Tax=Nannocystis sp. TaxID=1962667 RepID=UPI0025E02395|nr:FHA domain-containing protein [Nannocystis sp.]MBK7824040.1 FHA domain-containing protein [Nannocystis sp.]